jgi:Tfp pilus assembly protein FimV
MIRLNCTNCKAQLSIDDAFAGGVCRCQYCGTIQTVPKHLKSAADSSGSVALKTGTKPSKKSHGDPNVSSGLDALANAVAGSGLAATVGRAKPPVKQRIAATSRSAPKASPPRPAPPVAAAVPPVPPTRPGLPLALIVAGLVILLLLGIVVGLLLKNHSAG